MSLDTHLKKYGYLALCEPRDLIKIGISQNPTERMRELRVGNPDIRLLLYFESGNREEKWLHKNFKNRKVAGEWFRFKSKEITSFFIELFSTLYILRLAGKEIWICEEYRDPLAKLWAQI